jgi:ribonuclease HII
MTPPSVDLERVLRGQGFTWVAGADEAGRGALAGPLVAAAVILPPDYLPDGLDDSKLVAPRERERLHAEISAAAVAVGIHRVTHQRVDALGVQRANLVALRAAIRKLDPQPEYTIVDGFALKRTAMPCLKMVKGDQVCAAVAAASIVAKVTRDRIMVRAARRYPGYAFESNKGYRAPEHLRELDLRGPCDIHRRSFAPVAQALHSAPSSRSAPASSPILVPDMASGGPT